MKGPRCRFPGQCLGARPKHCPMQTKITDKDLECLEHVLAEHKAAAQTV